MATAEEAIQGLREGLNKNIKRHASWSDSLYLNGGTVLALAATGTATLLPSSLSMWAKIASAMATFVIALSRALNFGGRWRFHVQMSNAYQGLLDRVNQLDVLPEGERNAAAAKIFDDLVKLRTKENARPGAGAADS
jgi:rhamnogalacturonyl hydrolase YesR